jgi:feruloyl esterase
MMQIPSGGGLREDNTMNCRLLLVGSAVGLFAMVALGPTPAAAWSCTNLKTLHLQETTITSAEENTTGKFIVPNSNPPITLTGRPPFCRVTATLTPTSDSTIKIEVWLPETTWNGRFLGTGGGGFQGLFTLSSYRDELSVGIMKGFATANSDLGTGSSGCNPLWCGSAGNMGNPVAIASGDPKEPSTGLFGHPERIKDFGYRAIHLMTVRGKEIVKAFYGQNAQKAYFGGCSTGGQNALMEAQRFPDDYNGILAGDAAFNRTHLHMGAVDAWQVTHAFSQVN